MYKILEKIELDIQKFVTPNLPRGTKKLIAFYIAFYQNNKM